MLRIWSPAHWIGHLNVTSVCVSLKVDTASPSSPLPKPSVLIDSLRFFPRITWIQPYAAIKLCHTSVYSTATATPPSLPTLPNPSLLTDIKHIITDAPPALDLNSWVYCEIRRDFLWRNQHCVNMFGGGLNVACSLIHNILEAQV